ncbi:Two-component regulator, signal transduction histidine kinase [Alteracholeplasma palmae J233]|uniref:histidine kinase n=1 Tax=Alteracholeplasma palmae (strain ATCC 49389 / J233) TaxID=1318466 RepID=U4KLH4_ALTPJ|nr:HAMP domain-containing sensor histidine kinase [Alteracholeplasma palmae]CCV64683.1 Two-component regulator, signal transduction histidine kinase [Alteracholeplasma palmae J233]
MFNKIRFHFLLISLGILCFVFLGLTTVVYVTSREKEANDRTLILEQIIKNPDDTNLSKSFYVETINNNIILTKYDSTFFKIESLEIITKTILNNKEKKGSIGNIYYLVKELPNEFYIISAVDRSFEIANLRYHLVNLVIMEVLIIALLGTFLWLASKWIVSPLETSFKRQKQFISDASHELKTPLTIISASAEVLRNDYKDNTWIDSIEDQIQRLNDLINQLISLSILDERTNAEQIESINLSNFINLNLLPYESLAYEKNKLFILDIAPDVMIKGNKVLLKQLIGIFIDNAFKYSDDNGRIEVSLNNKKRPELKFYNTGCEITPEKKEAIFDRFYRADESRNSYKKGFGLGLSIAKKICDQYNYQLNLEAKYHEFTSFVITF